jgi:hypothetical protein
MAVLVVISLVLLVGVAVITLGGSSAPRIALTVFTGAVTILRPGAATAVRGRTGDTLIANESVATAADTKGAISYPDGSVTRLDSDTRVTVSITRDANGALHTSLLQPLGLTWNAVQRLVGGATFKVSGPNSASAEVRGTRFGYYVEHDPAGNPVIWIDTWSGSVLVTGSTGPPVLAATGQRVTVRQGAAPTTPVAIPAGDFQLSFTVFNQTIEAVAGRPFVFENGTLSSGQVTQTYPVSADGKSDLQFVLGWPGSSSELTVLDPDGNVFSQTTSSAAPISVVAARARAGTWKFRVRDVQSDSPEPWWVIVGH